MAVVAQIIQDLGPSAVPLVEVQQGRPVEDVIGELGPDAVGEVEVL